jgi:hypothetical protein
MHIYRRQRWKADGGVHPILAKGEEMKFLIAGLGSIGRRHFRWLCGDVLSISSHK